MFSKTTTLLTARTNRLAVNAELPESTTHTYILIFDSVRAGRLMKGTVTQMVMHASGKLQMAFSCNELFILCPCRLLKVICLFRIVLCITY
jgi:hypothetical protein